MFLERHIKIKGQNVYSVLLNASEKKKKGRPREGDEQM